MRLDAGRAAGQVAQAVRAVDRAERQDEIFRLGADGRVLVGEGDRLVQDPVGGGERLACWVLVRGGVGRGVRTVCKSPWGSGARRGGSR